MICQRLFLIRIFDRYCWRIDGFILIRFIFNAAGNPQKFASEFQDLHHQMVTTEWTNSTTIYIRRRCGTFQRWRSKTWGGIRWNFRRRATFDRIHYLYVRRQDVTYNKCFSMRGNMKIIRCRSSQNENRGEKNWNHSYQFWRLFQLHGQYWSS